MRQKRELTEEEKAKLKRQGFKKGQSGNPKGRPPMPQELKTKAAYMAPEMLDNLYDLANNSTNEMVRLKASETILALNVSKAAQEQKVDVDVRVEVSDLLARVNRRRNVIEGEFAWPAPQAITKSTNTD